MKNFINRRMILAILTTMVFGALIVLQSCSKNLEKPNLENTNVETTSNLTWSQQLNLSILNGKSVLKSCTITKESNLKLVGYKVLKSITNNSDVYEVKNELLGFTSVFPYLDLEKNKFTLLTKSEISHQKSYEGVDYSFASLSKFLDKTINVGLKEIELTWECDSKRYTSICLASEDKGIIYDNIISNLLPIRVSNKGKNIKVVSKTMRFKTMAEGGVTSGPTSWSLYDGVDWIWGSTRGEVNLSHTLKLNGALVTGSDHSESIWMTLGTCQVSGETYDKNVPSETGSSKYVYGYAFATPLMTVSVSVNEGGATVSVSGVLGSEMHASGTNTLP